MQSIGVLFKERRPKAAYGHLLPQGEKGRSAALLLLRRCPLHKRLAALHLVGQRRLVDLDHDGIGVDAEVLHQRLRDVAHHAGLLLIGAAGGHAHGNFRHSCHSLCSCYVTLATNTILILRSGLLAASRRMRLLSSWFETAQERLLTMRSISTSLRAYQESCVLHQPMQPAVPWSGPHPASADIRRDLFRVLPVRRRG